MALTGLQSVLPLAQAVLPGRVCGSGTWRVGEVPEFQHPPPPSFPLRTHMHAHAHTRGGGWVVVCGASDRAAEAGGGGQGAGGGGAVNLQQLSATSTAPCRQQLAPWDDSFSEPHPDLGSRCAEPKSGCPTLRPGRGPPPPPARRVAVRWPRPFLRLAFSSASRGRCRAPHIAAVGDLTGDL